LSLGHTNLLLLYLLPVIISAIILNIPQTVSMTTTGFKMESDNTYMDFLLYFQLFHPLLTTVSIPFIFLIWMNSKIFLRIKARRVRMVNRRVPRHTEAVQVGYWYKNKHFGSSRV
jgi:hypothetical protein